MNKKERNSSTQQFFQWTQQYFGLWSLICTPNHEHMNPSILVDIIKKLSSAGLDELIFVMLAVHQNEPFVLHFYRTMLLDLIAEHWDTDREHIINKMIKHLE